MTATQAPENARNGNSNDSSNGNSEVAIASNGRKYGVHEWGDRHGNHGMEVLSRRQVDYRAIRSDGLFDFNPAVNSDEIASIKLPQLSDYFHPTGNSLKRRRVFVVVDGQLPESRKAQIESYFWRCKSAKLLEDYAILSFTRQEKTLRKVTDVIEAAKKFGIRRRDLFIAIGDTLVNDVVGFAAGIYRRSVPWISVPTDAAGIISCHSADFGKITLDHRSGDNGKAYEGILELDHPPLASFYDIGFLGLQHKKEVARSLAAAGTSNGVYERSTSEDVRYHVASAKDIFGKSNRTLIQDYCIDNVKGRKKKVLVIVDDYPGNTLPDITSYFKMHTSAIDNYRILPMRISSNRKDSDNVLRIIDAAIALSMSSSDMFVVVGGGTIMDVVGFAAAMYKGGTDYVRIPTTLLGIIDAGVGVKVGVNLGESKNCIGRYFAPVACLNDPASFLHTLPQREFACGLAEAIKMAILKSTRLFEVIEKHHRRDTGYNAIYTDEVIYLSVLTMLEELQPNLHEESLIRLVDFGHEFGHIIEGLVRYELPHGECVSIGMAISSYISYLKGILSLADLERILNLCLDMGLPIYVTDYNSCDPGILWDKISTDGVEHKDGMLYLAIPETVGRASFLDELSEIDGAILKETMLSLKQYQEEYTSKIANGSSDVGPSSTAEVLMSEVDKRLRAGGILCPTGYPELFKPSTNEIVPTGNAQDLKFVRHKENKKFRLEDGDASPLTETLERSLNKWFERLSMGYQQALEKYMRDMNGFPLRLRSDAAMTQLGEFTINGLISDRDEQVTYWGYIDLHAGLAARAANSSIQDKVDDIVGHEGYHLLAFLSRGCKPLLSEWEREREEANAAKWRDFLGHREKPHVLVLDVGATNLRIGVLGPHSLLIQDQPVRRIPSPSHLSYPEDTLAKLQDRLLGTIVSEIDTVRAVHPKILLEEVAISFGAVINNQGIVEDASILWNDSAKGYDLKAALRERLPGTRLTVLNDVSAAAWRYEDEGRFCLITVSSGLSNKVFNPDLGAADNLDLDAAGVGGEMGHVVVEPRSVDALVRHAIMSSAIKSDEFATSQLRTYVGDDVRKINAMHLGLSAKAGDAFVLRMLEDMNIPYCACGNIADLCSYSSGRGALRYAKRLAVRGDYDVKPEDVTDDWLKDAIEKGHPLALKVLNDSTYPLALRVLQLASDIGLEKFIIVGGFAVKTCKEAYLQALQDHMVRFCYNSGYYADWSEDKVRGLVEFGVGDDNDGLIGIGRYVQHLRSRYRAVIKAIGEPTLSLVNNRTIPRVGAREILTKVIYTGICTTDLQILRAERGFDPVVLGHEGVLRVIEVGKDVKGLKPGDLAVLNPNNPLDDYEKLGHNFEGLFQDYFKFGQEMLEKDQVLVIPDTVALPAYTLIEPLSCIVAAQGRIKDEWVRGKNVLVLGAGIMGLMFVLTSRINGARNVFLANRSQEKLDFAVEKEIIKRDRTFAITSDIGSQVKEISKGEGVDVIFVCVSMGQGASSAQDAAVYVNEGGLIYLFAGFRAGDYVTVDGGDRVDLTPIRVEWKTEEAKIANKKFYLSGHRGSRLQDLSLSADMIRKDTIAFTKLISHVISLDKVPEIASTLTKSQNILGMQAKRVIVDMEAASTGIVEFIEELPVRHVLEAAKKRKDAVRIGNVFREIGFEDDDAQALGWVHPPVWSEVEVAVEKVLQLKALSSKKDFIFVGTGAWGFVVDALRDAMPSSDDGASIHTIQSLDPQALVDLFTRVNDLSTAVCLGISKSGGTIETVMLMKALRERFDATGLDYKDHFVWLTDLPNSTIQETWKDVDIVPLTVRNYADINALFCTPHSLVPFLVLTILSGKELDPMKETYQQYLSHNKTALPYIAYKANHVASNKVQLMQFQLPKSIAGSRALVGLVTQLLQQSLGSKLPGFDPRVHITSSDEYPSGFEVIPLVLPEETSPAVQVMLTMTILSVFVAAVAYHMRIPFAVHPKVDLYKRRAKELVTSNEPGEQTVSTLETIGEHVKTYLGNNPQIKFVDALCYGTVSSSFKKSITDLLVNQVGDVLVEFFQGEEWNHSMYQAAVQKEDTLHVVVVLEKYKDEVEGVSSETVQSNIKMLKAIARGAYETLDPGALYFRVEGDV